MSELTDKDRTAAIKALVEWFKSQDINCQEAAIVMIELQAQCLVDKTTSINALQESVNIFRDALIFNIAILLKQKV